ncbi:MAG: translocation/assembly module TamB domain-containing protein [Bacteroidia bacterium]
MDVLIIQFLMFILDPRLFPNDTTRSTPQKIFFWKAALNNIDFTYEYRDSIAKPVKGMNYDHLRIRDIDANLDLFTIINDSLSGKIRNMHCREVSGFGINELSSDFIISYNAMEFANLQVKSDKSSLEGKVRFDYSSYDDLSDFIDSVDIQGKIKTSKINLDELHVFSEELKGLNLDVQFAGNLKGKINNLKSKNALVEWGNSSKIAGDFHFIGLPETDSMYYSLKLNRFNTDAKDIALIPAYPFLSGNKIEIPKEIYTLEKIDFKGKVSGTLDNSSLEGELESSIGKLIADINLRYDNEIKDYRYDGYVSTESLELGKIIKVNPQLGFVKGNALIHGQSFDRNKVEAFLSGEIEYMDLAGYRVQNIKASGEIARNIYNGKFSIADPNLRISFNGFADLSKANGKFDFSSSIDRINLNALGLTKRDSAFIVSTEIATEFTGNNIDNLHGQIELIASKITYGSQQYFVDDLLLEASGSPYDRAIKLYSDMFDLEVNGAFRMEELQAGISEVLNTFLPKSSLIPIAQKESDFVQNFKFNIKVKHLELLQSLFFPDLEFLPGSTVSGRFDAQRQFVDIQANGPKWVASGVEFIQPLIKAKAENHVLGIDFYSASVKLSDSLAVRHVSLHSSAISDSMDARLEWASRSDIRDADAQLNTRIWFIDDVIHLNILPSIILVGDSLWQVNEDNYISYEKGIWDIENLSFIHNNEFLRVDGKISKDPKHELDINLDKFSLNNVNPFISNNDIQLDGFVNGVVSFSNLFEKPLFTSNLELNGIRVNKDFIGDGSIISRWDPEEKKISLNGFIGTKEFKKIDFQGQIFTAKKENNLDLHCKIRNLKLELIKPYVSDLFSNVTGLLDGDIHITGSPEKPVADGELSFDKRTFITVDILNTRYQVLDKIQFRKNLITSKTLYLKDINQNIARCDVKVTHDYFKNFNLDIRINFDKMQTLNTNENQSDLFFGTAYASGNFRAYGPIDNIVMDINARTERGTVFNLPLSGTSDVNEQNFVTFQSASGIKNSVKGSNTKKVEAKGYELNFNLEVTPEAEARLLFDPKVGDIISGNGTANLRLEVTEAGEFNVFGDYQINKGEYLFTLQNIINKKFQVQKGGVINFKGDPYDADIDLTAAYRVRTPLYQLVKNIDSTAAVKRPIDVDATMMLTDKLMKPRISFDIVLPNSDDQTRNLLKSQIVNEDDLNRQVFSLVVFRTFMPSQNGVASLAPISNVGSNVSELLSSQLSNMLSQLSSDVNLGVNYVQGGTGVNDQVNVNLSTQLFNDRVLIDGSLGTTTAGNTNSINNTTGMVGEFNIEIKITEDGAVRIKAFNRSNQYLLITNDVPYTQGVGVFYRREFDDWEEFRGKSKRSVL